MATDDSNKKGRQLFPAYSDVLARWVIAVLAVSGVTIAYASYRGYRSDWWQRRNLAPDQPVLFSHHHHTVELKIDCRYCHTSVESSSFAGMPATETCLTCHSGVFTDSPMLAPVINSAVSNKPLKWTRVYDLPDYVYFNHSIHIAKSIGCTTCHGDIGRQRLTRKAQPLYMSWCLGCHRAPDRFVRRPADVFSPSAPATPELSGAERAQLVSRLGIGGKPLTDCITCHR